VGCWETFEDRVRCGRSGPAAVCSSACPNTARVECFGTLLGSPLPPG